MTIEQINKGADSYIELISAGKASEELKGALKSAFASGSHMTNEYWKDRTKWKSLEKEPPKYEGVKYQILVRYSPGLHDVVCVIGLQSVENMISAGYRDWKEID